MRVSGFSAILAALAGAWLILLLLALAATAGATPAEPPPGWFQGAQYIDSAGCVFVRAGESGGGGEGAGAGWQARLDRAGGPVCGLPPTLSARRTRPDEVAALVPVPEEPRGRRMERALVEAIIPNLRTGELVLGALPGDAPEAPVPPARTDAAGMAVPGLRAAVAAAPALRAAMGPGAPRAGRLCGLLDASPAVPPLGQGQALGLCAGRALTLAPVAGPVPERKMPQAPAPKAAPAPASEAAPLRAAATARDGGARRTGPALAAASGAGMVPADARFVQVGAYADPAGAEAAIRRLAALGLPVARARQAQGGRAVQVIMAGPFEDRQAVVRALDRVRKAGFARAWARR